MPTIKKLMLNGIAYKRKEGTPIPEDAILLESGYEILLENGNYLAKEVPPSPTLLSYEEIKAMNDAGGATQLNGRTELNKYPEEYYNKFNSEGRMGPALMLNYRLTGTSYELGIDDGGVYQREVVN